MELSKVFDWITPLTLLALAGVYTIGIGITHWGQENNALQFIFGVPLTIGPLIGHFLIRQVLMRNTLRIWILEAVLVGICVVAFQFM
ncbi:hypothetical protein GCM10027299_23010 [Larkinella ripae]